MVCRRRLYRLMMTLTLAGITVAACTPPGAIRSATVTPSISLTPSATARVSGNGISTSGTNSPQFHFNAAHSGVNPYENVISPSNVSRLVTAWTDTVTNAVNSSPAVVDGVAYVSASNGFYAFNATTGTLLWAAPGIFFDQSSPAVANGVAYAAAVDGHFYAFSTNIGSADCSGVPVTCKPLWTAAIDGAGSIAQSSPAVADGIAYVTAGYNLYAFNARGCSAATCKPLWTAAISPVNGESPASGQSSPAVVGGVLYVGGYEGLYAYSAAGTSGCSGTPKTCSPLWVGQTAQMGLGLANTVSASSPAVVDGVAYLGGGNDLFAFSTTCSGTCNPLWSYATGGQISSSPAVANGRVYLGSSDGKMYVFSTSGVLQWSARGAGGSSSPTVANGVVYMASFHNINAFSAGGCSAATCSPLWTAPLDDSNFASPVVANGLVYIGDVANGQYLSAYKLP